MKRFIGEIYGWTDGRINGEVDWMDRQIVSLNGGIYWRDFWMTDG